MESRAARLPEPDPDQTVPLLDGIGSDTGTERYSRLSGNGHALTVEGVHESAQATAHVVADECAC